MSDFYLGQIVLFAGNFVPVGWVACNGALLPISQYDALYSILGTTYGGDGQSTFGVPDLRGAVPVSAGQAPGRSNYSLGQPGGSESVTLTAAQMPSHNHPVVPSASVNVSSAAADQTSPSNNYFAKTTGDFYNATGGAALSTAVASYAATLTPAGSSQPIDTMGPYLAMNYCMCSEGLYPPRS